MHVLDSSSESGAESVAEEWTKLGEVIDNASRVIGSPSSLAELLQALIRDHDQKRSLQERNAVLLEDKDRLNKLLAEQKEKEIRMEQLLRQLVLHDTNASEEPVNSDMLLLATGEVETERVQPETPLADVEISQVASAPADALSEVASATHTEPISPLPTEDEDNKIESAAADPAAATDAAAGLQTGADCTLRRLLLPEILNTPTNSRYFNKWQAALSNSEPDYLLFAMLSNLFTWTCAMANRKQEAGVASSAALEKESCAGLYNFSRYLFDYLYANGEEPEAAEAIVCDLMNGINKLLENDGAKYELMLPYLGSPYNTKTMIPDARGESIGSVYKLRSWGLKVRGSDMMHQKCLVELD